AMLASRSAGRWPAPNLRFQISDFRFALINAETPKSEIVNRQSEITMPPPFHEARLIAFDNDGTLYPAGLEVASAVLDAHREYMRLRGLDIPTPGIDWVRRQLGADALDFYGAMLPGLGEEVRADFERFCLEYEREAVGRFAY